MSKEKDHVRSALIVTTIDHLSRITDNNPKTALKILSVCAVHFMLLADATDIEIETDNLIVKIQVEAK